MDDNRLMEAEWLIYLTSVINKKAGPDQINETKRGFMAGAAALLSVVFAGETEAAIEDRIVSLKTELLAYAAAEAGIAESAMEGLVGALAKALKDGTIQ